MAYSNIKILLFSRHGLVCFGQKPLGYHVTVRAKKSSQTTLEWEDPRNSRYKKIIRFNIRCLVFLCTDEPFTKDNVDIRRKSLLSIDLCVLNVNNFKNFKLIQDY